MIKENEQVPNFKFVRADGSKGSLEDYRGSVVVLYFYPKDNTSGCTKQACDFRDQMKSFKKNDAIVLGVSRDSYKSHQNFIDKFNLPFELISDPDEKICKLFDVMKTKSLYGKQYLGIERSTFLIDQNGVLRKIWRNVKVSDHVNEVLEQVRS